jgi:hypothetical protein
LDDTGFESQQEHDVSLPLNTQADSGDHKESPIQQEPEVLFPEVRRPGLELGSSPKYIAVVNTLRTGDADLRLYITTVQDG